MIVGVRDRLTEGTRPRIIGVSHGEGVGESTGAERQHQHGWGKGNFEPYHKLDI